MSSRNAVRIAALVASVLGPALAGCRNPNLAGQPVHAATSPPAEALYTARVQPILRDNCYRCHAGLNHRGGLVLDSRAGILKGGHDGPVIIPGHPEQSLLVKLIRHEGPANDPMPMPPKSKLPDADIATIEQWIRAGAAMPADPPVE